MSFDFGTPTSDVGYVPELEHCRQMIMRAREKFYALTDDAFAV
jgi:hypothetical protein